MRSLKEKIWGEWYDVNEDEEDREEESEAEGEQKLMEFILQLESAADYYNKIDIQRL